MAQSTVSYLWRDRKAADGYRAGVSLHSHTNQSKETLDFLANFGNQYPLMRPIISRMERRSKDNHSVAVNYAANAKAAEATVAEIKKSGGHAQAFQVQPKPAVHPFDGALVPGEHGDPQVGPVSLRC